MVDFVELSKQANSVRTIEELLVEFVPQFSNFSAESQQVICRDTNDN